MDAAGRMGIVGMVGLKGFVHVESHREFQIFTRRVAKVGSVGVGMRMKGAAGASGIRAGSVADGFILIGAGAGPA